MSEQILPAKSAPHSLEAEQSIIGALMLDADLWEQASDGLDVSDFYQYEHQKIYDAMVALLESNSAPDPITIVEELERRGDLEDAGGREYCFELADTAGDPSNMRAYIEIVKELSIQRKLIKVAAKITQDSYDPDGRSAADLLDEAERLVFQIAEDRPKEGGPQSINPLLLATLKKIDELGKQEGDITGLVTGFDDLDKITSGLQNSDLIILAARPAMGKTTLAMNLVESAILVQDKPVIVFSLEMPADQLLQRMLSAVARVNQGKVRSGQLSDDEWDKIHLAGSTLSNRPLFIDDTAGISPMEMRSRIRRIAREHGAPAMIMVDYLQLMQIKGYTEGRTNEISEISRSLKAMAKEFQCPVIALSQLNRSLENRPNKRPVNSDLRESGAIEQDADIIMFIYRDEVYNADREENKNRAELILGKHRNGAIGTVQLAFRGEFTKFDNLTPDQYRDLEDE